MSCGSLLRCCLVVLCVDHSYSTQLVFFVHTWFPLLSVLVGALPILWADAEKMNLVKGGRGAFDLRLTDAQDQKKGSQVPRRQAPLPH